MQQNGSHWRLVLGKMFLGVALAINNLFGGDLGGQLIRLPEVDARELAGAPPDDPSRNGDGDQASDESHR